jgi:hypothetical protein
MTQTIETPAPPTPTAPSVATDDQRYVSVRHASMLLDSTCRSCRKVATGWLVADGGHALCPGCDGRFRRRPVGRRS